MAAIAKFAANKMLSREMKKYKDRNVSEKDKYNPYYAMIPHPTKPGKFKKVKKQIPDYIPEKDAEILAAARKSAYRLDYCLFNFLYIRFGWSSVIGLVPVFGDFLDFFLAIRLIWRFKKITGGVPGGLWFKMIMCLLFDLGIGFIPVVGDLIDAGVKANSMNVRFLEKHLDELYKPKALEEKEKEENKKLEELKLPRRRPASVYVDLSDEEDSRRTTFENEHDDVRRPNRTYSPTRARIPDEEMGLPQEGRGGDRQQPMRNDRGTRSGRH